MTYYDLPQDMQEGYEWLDEESKQAEIILEDGQDYRFKPDPAISIIWDSRMLNMNIFTREAREKKAPA